MVSWNEEAFDLIWNLFPVMCSQQSDAAYSSTVKSVKPPFNPQQWGKHLTLKMTMIYDGIVKKNV